MSPPAAPNRGWPRASARVRRSTAAKSPCWCPRLRCISNGWGGRINYTYSNLKDNQFGETNSYQSTNGNMQNAYGLSNFGEIMAASTIDGRSR